MFRIGGLVFVLKHEFRKMKMWAEIKSVRFNKLATINCFSIYSGKMGFTDLA